ncbi:hypothetical protein GBAR_LOCUS25555 [Geodia barretti]|uniref:Uncharacterized protein n=1 Tax=Geodia barretti TaxID=519541 RepID=A0AA35TE17_GEOBA|nr:hypothetical protein GBAR_LOCUS25555 [Geodia barretti]
MLYSSRYWFQTLAKRVQSGWNMWTLMNQDIACVIRSLMEKWLAVIMQSVRLSGSTMGVLEYWNLQRESGTVPNVL